MKQEESVDYHIKFAWHHINKMYNAEASEHGTTTAHAYVLLNIDKAKGTPATQIGPKLGMEPNSLGRILNTLEELGYIKRTVDEKDKRKIIISLTKQGLFQREIAANVVKKFNYKVRSKVTDEELNAFFKVITQIQKIAKNPKTNYEEESN